MSPILFFSISTVSIQSENFSGPPLTRIVYSEIIYQLELCNKICYVNYDCVNMSKDLHP